MTDFCRGVRIPIRITSTPVAVNTASSAVRKEASGLAEDPHTPGRALDHRRHVRLGSVQQVHVHDLADKDRPGPRP
jgi:hypothetical protein